MSRRSKMRTPKKNPAEIVPVISGSASPKTKQSAQEAVQNSPGYYSPSKVNNGRTTTPRKRQVTPASKTKFSYRKGGVARNLEIEFSQVENKDINSRKIAPNITLRVLPTDRLPTYRQEFETIIITADELKNTPNRKYVKMQNVVMDGQSAKAEMSDFINHLKNILPKKDVNFLIENLPRTFNWCHIVAFCLAACVTNTQVKEDLTAGSWQCNSEMIPYETGLRKHLLSGESFTKIEIKGYALNFLNSIVAKKIVLEIKLTYPLGNTIAFEVEFDGLAARRKPKEIPTMVFGVCSIFKEKRYKPTPQTTSNSESESDSEDSSASESSEDDSEAQSERGSSEDETVAEDETEDDDAMETDESSENDNHNLMQF